MLLHKDLLIEIDQGEAFSFSLEVFDSEGSDRLLVFPVDVNEAVVDGAGVGSGDPDRRGIVGGTGVGHAAGGHFVKLEWEMGGVIGEFTNFREVAVAAEENGRSHIACPEEVNEFSALIGHVGPLFETVVGGQDLDGADDEVEFGGLFEFGGEPLPLGFAEDGGFGAGLGEVDFAFALFHFNVGTAEVAGVEHDDLEAFSFGAHDFGMIDAGGFAGLVVGLKMEGLKEEFGGSLLHLELAPGVIEAVIVIIPNGEDGDGLGEGRVVGLGVEEAILFLHDLGIRGVGVNGVAHEEEGLRLVSGDGLPDAVVPLGLVAGAAGEASDGFFSEGGKSEEENEKFFHELFLVDDHRFTMVQNLLKVVVFEERVGVVRGEALLSAGAFGKIPGVSGGG